MPIDISNVMIWNPEKNRTDRVGFKIDKDGKKARIFRSTGAVVDL
jgi:large subunit ribosomal protein L24